MDSKHRFTSKQITVMVVAMCMAVISAPVAVYAATGSFVNITDPVTAAYKARVSAKGSLATSPRDPVSGVNAKVDAHGRQLVASAPTLGRSVNLSGSSALNNGALGNNTAAFPAGTRVAITSVTLINDSASLGYVTLGADKLIGATTCGDGGYVEVAPPPIPVIAVPPGGTTHITYPYPVVASATQPFCLGVHNTGPGPSIFAHAVGYIV